MAAQHGEISFPDSDESSLLDARAAPKVVTGSPPEILMRA
jgi:hypothetical protein